MVRCEKCPAEATVEIQPLVCRHHSDRQHALPCQPARFCEEHWWAFVAHTYERRKGLHVCVPGES